jgi:hypothetical protein
MNYLDASVVECIIKVKINGELKEYKGIVSILKQLNDK